MDVRPELRDVPFPSARHRIRSAAELRRQRQADAESATATRQRRLRQLARGYRVEAGQLVGVARREHERHQAARQRYLSARQGDVDPVVELELRSAARTARYAAAAAQVELRFACNGALGSAAMAAAEGDRTDEG